MRKAALAMGLALGATASAAAAPSCFVPYEEFEKTVPHVDLHACPVDPLPAEKGFCRLSLEGERVRVYRFEFGAADACLTRIETYAFAEFVKRFGASYEPK